MDRDWTRTHPAQEFLEFFLGPLSQIFWEIKIGLLASLEGDPAALRFAPLASTGSRVVAAPTVRVANLMPQYEIARASPGAKGGFVADHDRAVNIGDHGVRICTPEDWIDDGLHGAKQFRLRLIHAAMTSTRPE